MGLKKGGGIALAHEQVIAKLLGLSDKGGEIKNMCFLNQNIK